MSAIWGAISLKGNIITKETQKKIRQAFDKCVIDRYEEIAMDNVYMGCGIQYFVPEAQKEKLPYAKDNLFFTADVVLDNRSELLEKLGITKEQGSNMADGDILFAVYKKYGRDCLNDLLGAYAFVWYDRSQNKIELVLDAVGNRCVYYRIIDDVFYFSSLIEPLVEIATDVQLNDRWLTDFLAMDHLYMINETEETPIADIYRIAPAQYISYCEGKIEKVSYWKPFEHFKEYRWNSDEEYKQRFIELWNRAVTCTIRDKSNTSILLSGGLDSTAVAAVAASYVKEDGESLYSYTSVPMEGYVTDNSGYDIENEKEDVEKTAAFYGNIITQYVDLNGKNPWELSNKAIRSMETPLKSIQNYLWIEEAMEKAYERQSRIMLTGSYGNTSISFTDLNVYMNTLYSKRKYVTLKKELDAFSANMGFPVRYAWKQIVSTGRKKFEPTPYPYGLSYVNRDIAKKVNSEKRLCEIEQNSFENIKDYESCRRNMVHWLSMRQIGEAFTKHSLATGVLLRDPTIDKRVIEFCIHMPMQQFCKEGLDRRLVKEYLKDIMPPHIIRFQKKGKQSADLEYRISLNWDNIRQEWINKYGSYSNSRYVNILYARRQLIEQENIEQYSSFALTRHMYTLLVLQYEDYFQKKYHMLHQKENTIGIEQNKPLISVIIPVYNSKDYLKACLESVCNQSYEKMEIIVVDDGSDDGSSDICDEMAKQDTRIHVIHKANGGVSAARNDAMKYAHGELYAFVDSDDVIEADMYERMLLLMQEQDADYVWCGAKYIKDGVASEYADGRVKVFHNAEIMDTYITAYQNCAMTIAMWNGLYKRKLFEGLEFPAVRKYEDGLVKARVMAKVKKAVFIDQAFYHYTLRGGGLSHAQMSRQDIEQLIRVSEIKNEVVEKLLCRTSCNIMYFQYYCLLLDLYFQINDRQCKKLLVSGMKRIRKQAREAILEKEEIRIKDKLAMMISTYSVQAYKLTLH